jgi:hypothetical protein
MTVPMAPDHSTTMLVVKSQKPISDAAGSGKSARTAVRLENANGQIRRGLFRLAMAAPTKVMNATRALKGRIRKPANTLIGYSLGSPLSTFICRRGGVAIGSALSEHVGRRDRDGGEQAPECQSNEQQGDDEPSDIVRHAVAG